MNKLIPAVVAGVVAIYLFSKMLDSSNKRVDYYLDPDVDYEVIGKIQNTERKVSFKMNDLIPPSMADSLSVSPMPQVAPLATPEPEPISFAPPAIDIPDFGFVPPTWSTSRW